MGNVKSWAGYVSVQEKAEGWPITKSDGKRCTSQRSQEFRRVDSS